MTIEFKDLKERVETVREYEHTRVLRVDGYKYFIQSKDTEQLRGYWKTAHTASYYAREFNKAWNDMSF